MFWSLGLEFAEETEGDGEAEIWRQKNGNTRREP